MILVKNTLKDLLEMSEDEVEMFIRFHSSFVSKNFLQTKHRFYNSEFFFNLVTTIASVEFKRDVKLYTIIALFFHSVEYRQMFVCDQEYADVLKLSAISLLRTNKFITEEEEQKLKHVLEMMVIHKHIVPTYSDLVLESDVILLQDILNLCTPISGRNFYVTYYDNIEKISFVYANSGDKPSINEVLNIMYSRYNLIKNKTIKSAFKYKIKKFTDFYSKNKY